MSETIPQQHHHKFMGGIVCSPSKIWLVYDIATPTLPSGNLTTENHYCHWEKCTIRLQI